MKEAINYLTQKMNEEDLHGAMFEAADKMLDAITAYQNALSLQYAISILEKAGNKNKS